MPFKPLKIPVLACHIIHNSKRFSCFHFAFPFQTDVDKNSHPQQKIFHFCPGATVAYFVRNSKVTCYNSGNQILLGFFLFALQ